VYTEHRIATAFAGAAGTREPTQKSTAAVAEGVTGQTGKAAVSQSGVRIGDRVAIRYLDDNKTATYTLSSDRDDPTNGLLSVTSPLGKQLLGLVEEDEAEFEANGRMRRVLIVRAERQAATLY
jgi:transcription elongation GreA/GreB family factor